LEDVGWNDYGWILIIPFDAEYAKTAASLWNDHLVVGQEDT
jgi:hypothetical protein